MTVKSLIANGALRSGRKVIFLGEQVTNFVLASLRRPDGVVGDNAWRALKKCTSYPLRADDEDARAGGFAGFYDFLAVPVWHPRILDDEKVRMPPG